MFFKITILFPNFIFSFLVHLISLVKVIHLKTAYVIIFLSLSRLGLSRNIYKENKNNKNRPNLKNFVLYFLCII